MPDWTAALASRLRPLALSPAREREIIEELSQHLDDRYAELRAEGRLEDEAFRLSIDEIEDGPLLAREMRTLRQSSAPEPIAPGAPARSWTAGVFQDLRYAVRMLRKSPGFATAAILTLALGIGANTAIFSLVDSVLLQRLPIANRDRLSFVFNGHDLSIVSYPAYTVLRDGVRQLDGLAAWGGITASLNADGETDLVSGVIVTGNFFDLLGVAPERGRLLTPADDVTPGAHPVAVISHRLWQGRFGGRPDIVGSQLRLNGSLFTVIGIAPEGFGGPQLGAQRDLFVPMMMQALMRPPRAGYSGDMDPDLLKNPRNGWLVMMALRKPSVTVPQAEAELVSVATNYLKTVNPGAPPPLLNLVSVDVGDPAVRSQLQSIAALLGCVVGAVLLIACANVANLLLSRATARRREIAVRLALGAGRWRIVRQLLTESLLLSTLGGAAGVLLAWLIVQWFTAAPPPTGALPIALEFAADQRVLLFSLLLSFATGLLFGMAPALQASRPGLVPALKDDAMTVGASRRFTLKNVLVVGEVAISCLLLVAAGLFIRSLRTVQAIDPGFAVEELASAPLNVNLLRYTRAQGRDFYARVVERMEQLPGVKSATVARVAVLTGSGRVTTIAVEGRPDSGARGQSEGGSVTTRAGENAMVNVVGPGYFRTLGIPLLRGRDFEPRDAESAPRVAIVSESMAKQFFPGEDPIGRRFTPGATATSDVRIEIVGVARDSKYGSLSEGASPVVYFPLAQQHETGVTLYVRAAGSPENLVSQLRREIQAIEPNLPVPDVHTVRETVGTSLYVPRMGAILLAVFGGLALLLAALGVYGVLAFSIARRTREIGIRVALGADRARVLRLIVREGMTLVLMGLVAGLAAGWFGATAIRRFLFDISPRDVTAFTVVPLILAAVALVACYLPARRAMRVDPMVALRDS